MLIKYITNSMDLVDVNNDGLLDIITGEHHETETVKIWRNTERGLVWAEDLVATGKESHLGTKAADLDGDGDLDIVSIAWDRHLDLHVWCNN